MTQFPPSELIVNADGSIFHLHLRPEQLADKVILVGDPDRVSLVASHFSEQECEVQSREFHTITGRYKEKRITVQSTGIGCDNIDIVLNELDALANINLSTRTQHPSLRSLDIVRIGTCGGLQPHTPIGTFICSRTSIGFDGLLNFYAGRHDVCDMRLEEAFVRHMNWSPLLPAPYAVDADEALSRRINTGDMTDGITISCGGFFGPQGRQLRIPLADPRQNEKIECFRHEGRCITNFEMESSAIAGLSRLLGHRATTVCMVIANRRAKEANADYRGTIDQLIEKVLERI